MKRMYYILPLLVLGACAQNQEDYYSDEVMFDDDSYYVEDSYQTDDSFYEEDTGLVLSDEGIIPETTPAQVPVPQEQAPTQNSTVVSEAKISSDGTMIEIPAQQIYIGDILADSKNQPNAQTMKMNTIAYSTPVTAQSVPQTKNTTYITLQNMTYPNTYAQCLTTDTACISAYMQQGYRQVQGLPQFAGYQDVLSSSDYPTNGRWRNNNNIPRW